MNIESATPLMQQYYTIKLEFSDALLLFQVGDFYELFFEDAKKAAHFLGITLTKRGKVNGEDIPLCGVPVHALDHYAQKLIKGGFKIAIVDQLEEARPGTVVRRGVTRVLTPGTLTEQQHLDAKSSSYLCSFVPLVDSWGILFGEILTSQLFATVIPVSNVKSLEAELVRFFPDEILLPKTVLAKKFEMQFKQSGYFTSVLDYAEHEHSIQDDLALWMGQQFKEDIIYEIKKQESLEKAFFYFYAYIKRNYNSALSAFNTVQLYKSEDFLLLDRMTERTLELVHNTQDGGRSNTLLSVLDSAVTSMGSRMIKKWIVRPLLQKDAIEQRQEVVALFVNNVIIQKKMTTLLLSIADIERVVGRILVQRASVQDYLALKKALRIVPEIVCLLQQYKHVLLFELMLNHIGSFDSLLLLLEQALHDDDSVDWIIKKGFDTNLDRLRVLKENGNQELLQLEQREQERTGINSLKIRYNGVHGYAIEITKAHAEKVPADYKRVQSLVGKERFMISELQVLQYEIDTAKNQIGVIEKELFEFVKQRTVLYGTSLRKLAYTLANLDALLGLAITAYNNNYVCPSLNNKRSIMISRGRHPVLEQVISTTFIANNTLLNEKQTVLIITGPNMGGKSTYLRQVALSCIMAHIGSFIPAESADIALLDRIFTRIGAGDNLAEGKSTFLVEMEETATICHYATKNSLVILDEVGRGTSTFDGLAIAQAVVEYLARPEGPYCLFATHYHELTFLRDQIPTIANFHAASTQTKAGILFLYKIIEGVAHGSFGIEVAKLAQLPSALIKRAYALVGHYNKSTIHLEAPMRQKSIFQEVDIEERLQNDTYQKIASLVNSIDLNDLSPKKAFDMIWLLKKEIEHNS